MAADYHHEVRREAVADCVALLELADLAVDPLLERAAKVLGATRAQRCAQLAQLAPLTARADATGAIAQFIVGTQRLGRAWWTRDHHELWCGIWQNRGTPDALLDADPNPDKDYRLGSCLDKLGDWISDAAADDESGAARWTTSTPTTHRRWTACGCPSTLFQATASWCVSIRAAECGPTWSTGRLRPDRTRLNGELDMVQSAPGWTPTASSTARPRTSAGRGARPSRA